jgi:hypothetical protein
VPEDHFGGEVASGWKREPFTSESTKHVSVWEKTGL